MYYISSSGYESLQCLQHFFSSSCRSAPQHPSSTLCFPLPAGIPCSSLITWFHGKSEILLVSDVCISHSLLILPQHPPYPLSFTPPRPNTSPDICREAAQREKVLCGTGRSQCECVTEREREKVGKKSMSLAGVLPSLRDTESRGKAMKREVGVSLAGTNAAHRWMGALKGSIAFGSTFNIRLSIWRMTAREGERV